MTVLIDTNVLVSAALSGRIAEFVINFRISPFAGNRKAIFRGIFLGIANCSHFSYNYHLVTRNIKDFQ
jgi:hypothetical protein